MAASGMEDQHILTLIWRVENIELLETKHVWWRIRSPTYRARTFDTKFILELFPTKNGDVCKHLNLCLYLWDEPLGFPIDCEWSILGRNGLPVVSGTLRNLDLKAFEPRDLPDFPTIEDVFQTRKFEFLPQDALTVRCRITKSHGSLAMDESISGLSRYEGEEDSFIWPIKGLNTLQLNKEVTTPVTFDICSESFEFKLVFSFEGQALEEASVKLELEALTIPETLEVSLKISVLDIEHRIVKCLENEVVGRGDLWNAKNFGKNSRLIWVLPKFLSRKDLLSQKFNCLRKDVLILFCEFTAFRLVNTIEKKFCAYSNLEVENPKKVSSS